MLKPLPKITDKMQLPDWFFSINRIWIAILFSILLGAIAFEQTTEANSPISPDDLYRCTNDMRLDKQLGKLYLNEDLNEAAAEKLKDMKKFSYWAHENPATGRMGWEFIDQAGYYYIDAGENLAIGYQTAQQICEGWENSPSHYANIINPEFQETGFAIDNATLTDEHSGILVVQLFGTKMGFEKTNASEKRCSGYIDRGISVLSPGCGISRRVENKLTINNPRRVELAIEIDGKSIPFTVTSKGRRLVYTFDKPLTLGSHEITVRKKTDLNKSVNIKLIVDLPENAEIGAIPATELLYASIFGPKQTSATFMIILVSLSAAGFLVWKQARE